MEVSCPRCAARVVWSEASPFRPFCSERCKMADLGAWANEEYKINSPVPPDNPDDTQH